jgi:UPF0755 protein
MGRSVGLRVFLVVLALLAVVTGAGLWLLWAPPEPASPAGPAGQAVTVVVPEGVSISKIGDILERQRLVRSSLAFRVLARLEGRSIQAGTYQVEPGSDLSAVLDVFTAGPTPGPTFTVTIPEGLTVEQTLERIAGAEGSPFTADQLREALADVEVPAWVPVTDLPAHAQRLEGLLFPNTYEFRLDASPQEVLSRLVSQTDHVLRATAIQDSGLSPYEVLILASLVEREARLPEERPRISAVIHNRLAEGLRLQIDATVLYALGEQKDRVLDADLEVDSLWNTYRNAGLPPTPIAGMGEASIRAAAQPSGEDSLYYVVDPQTGRHRFSRTYAEHQQAIAEIRRRQTS